MNRTQQHPLRTLRERHNLSIQALADATHLSKRTILRAEQGYSLHPESRRILCDYFGASPQELGLLSSVNEEDNEHRVLFAPGSRELDHLGDILQQPGFLREVEKYMAHEDISRRALLQRLLGLVSLTVPTLSLIPTDSHLLTEADQRLSRAISDPTALNEATITHYEQLTSLCWQLSEQDGLGLIEQILPSYLPALTTLAQQQGKYQTRIASITAQSYLLYYVVALHREDFQRALSSCRQARIFGQLARDPNLEVVSLLRQGNVYLYLHSPWRTLESYQEALPHVGNISALVQARLHAVMAEVQGKLGTEADVRASIGAAYHAFPSDSKDNPATQYIHFSQSGLYLHEGLAFLNLHQGKQAAVALEQVNGLAPKLPISERSRIDLLIQQSWAASQIGDLDMFCTHIDAAIASARKLGSDLLLSEAWECYSRQGQWKQEKQFKRLGEQFNRA